MQNWEIETFRKVFKRCYGLQHAIIKAFEGKDINHQNECLKTLENQSGMQIKFLKQNFNQIITL